MSARRFLSVALFSALLLGATAQETQWKLDWMDDFNGPELDTTVWSPIKRGAADWNNTMTPVCLSPATAASYSKACCQTTRKPTPFPM